MNPPNSNWGSLGQVSTGTQGQRLNEFWQGQIEAIEQIQDTSKHDLPPTRVKRIMKSDGVCRFSPTVNE